MKDEQERSLINTLLNDLFSIPKTVGSFPIFRKLTPLATILLLLSLSLTVISNVNTSGLIFGTIKGLAGTIMLVLIFGYPTTWAIRRFKKTERYIWNDAILCGIAWQVILTIILILYVLQNLE